MEWKDFTVAQISNSEIKQHSRFEQMSQGTDDGEGRQCFSLLRQEITNMQRRVEGTLLCSSVIGSISVNS